jgi:Zn-dependent peptidase ImmA (M78 family)/transcriptional regulator with XRE-family HTH domain
MIGERIKRARAAAGLSQREAARRAELSAMAISKFERGESTPTSRTLIRLARALGTRTEFFLRPDTVELAKPEYRKRSSLGKKALAQIEADILDQVERLLEVVSLFPVPPVPDFAVPVDVPEHIATMQDVETAAMALREAWRLGLNAIPRLADTLEERGLLVLTTAADGTRKFDGLAASVGGRPLVVVGRDWPGDRQRFTMAHELGHLVLAGRLSEDLEQEKACDRFAGSFLVPRDTAVSELGSRRSRLEPRELHSLKHAYGVSMMAWVFRARDAQIIEARTADIIFRMFSKRGWRKLEPGEPVVSESPKLFERLVVRALAEDMVSMSKAAELMAMSIGQLRQRLCLEGRT